MLCLHGRRRSVSMDPALGPGGGSSSARGDSAAPAGTKAISGPPSSRGDALLRRHHGYGTSAEIAHDSELRHVASAVGTGGSRPNGPARDSVRRLVDLCTCVLLRAAPKPP